MMDAMKQAILNKMKQAAEPIQITPEDETTIPHDNLGNRLIQGYNQFVSPAIQKTNEMFPNNPFVGALANSVPNQIDERSNADIKRNFQKQSDPQELAFNMGMGPMGLIGGIEDRAGGKVVSMFDPEVQALRKKLFGETIEEPAGKIRDLVSKNRKNFPELKPIEGGLPSDDVFKSQMDSLDVPQYKQPNDDVSEYLSRKESAEDKALDRWGDMGGKNKVPANRKNFPELDVAPEKPLSKFAMNEDGMTPWEAIKNRFGENSSQIEKYISKAGKSDQPYVNVEKGALPVLPNENVSAKVLGNPGIQEPYSNKNTDPVPWIDQKYQITKKHLQSMNEPATINTSSDLIAHDDYIKALPKDSTVNIYALPGNPNLNRSLFPGSPSRLRQESAYQKLKDAGVNVNWIEPTVDDVLQAIKNKTSQGWDSNAASISDMKKLKPVDDFIRSKLGVDLSPTANAFDKAEFARMLQLKPKLVTKE